MATFLTPPIRMYDSHGSRIRYAGRMRISRPVIDCHEDPILKSAFDDLVVEQIKYIEKLKYRIPGEKWTTPPPKIEELIIDGIKMQGVFVIEDHGDFTYTLSVDNLVDQNTYIEEEELCQEQDLDTSNATLEKWSLSRLLNLIIYGKLGKRKLKNSSNNSWNHGLV